MTPMCQSCSAINEVAAVLAHRANPSPSTNHDEQQDEHKADENEGFGDCKRPRHVDNYVSKPALN
jgi:hypothetical protein